MARHIYLYFPNHLLASIKKKLETKLLIPKPNWSHPFSTNLEDEILFKGGRICNTHFIRKSKRRNYIPLNTCVSFLFIISCEHLI
jgi:hypothetical protein